MKKIVSILILTAMLLSCFAMTACNKQTEQTEMTTQSEGNGTALDGTGDADVKDPTKLDVPKDLDYDGDSFIIKTYTTSIPEYCDHNMERPDTVEAALIERDFYAQEYMHAV